MGALLSFQHDLSARVVEMTGSQESMGAHRCWHVEIQRAGYEVYILDPFEGDPEVRLILKGILRFHFA